MHYTHTTHITHTHHTHHTHTHTHIEFEKQRLGSIRPLEEMVVTSEEGVTPCLHDNEDQWRALCETRFGLMVNLPPPHAHTHTHSSHSLFTSASLFSPLSSSQEIPPSYATVSLPWKHLYLQHNLQELVGKLNDNPDFKVCWR